MSSVGVEYIVADSGAFIKAAPLEKWAGRVLTVKEVVEEIRDVHTRRRLQVLPYELVFREPSQEALHHGETDTSGKGNNVKKFSAIELCLLHHFNCYVHIKGADSFGIIPSFSPCFLYIML